VTPELESIRARWDDIRAAARARHHRAGAMLNSQCFIKSFEGDRVEIGFSAPILIEKTQTMEEGAVMRAIRDVVIEAVGRPVEVDLVLWEDLQRAGSAPAPKARSGVSHLVDEALKQGARPVEGASSG
jgi:hypothetical protein